MTRPGRGSVPVTAAGRPDLQDDTLGTAGTFGPSRQDIEFAIGVLAEAFDEHPHVEQLLELAGLQVGDVEEPVRSAQMYFPFNSGTFEPRYTNPPTMAIRVILLAVASK